MRSFEYIRATNLEHACRLLSEYQGRAKVMAGGQSLLIMIKQGGVAAEYVIDIGRLPELQYITARDDGLAIGALTTHRALETSPIVGQRFPMLVEMEKVLGWVQIRNRGTVCGNLCHADPASNVAPALLALGARVKVASLRGTREIPLEKLFVSYLETTLAQDEIMVEIVVPNLADGTQGAYVKESARVGDGCIAAAAAVVSLERDVIKAARIALGGVGATPLRAKNAEGLAIGRRAGAALEEVAEAAAAESEPVGDIEGSDEYKRQIVRVVAREALSRAIDRARGTYETRGRSR